MLLINLEARLKNKAFWVSLISAIVLLSQQFGFDITTIIPKNYADIINTIFLILTILGITVDTSTPGVSDQVKTDEATTSINNTISENSQDAAIDNLNASSKIVVDVPIE